jgi:hypothetical protein
MVLIVRNIGEYYFFLGSLNCRGKPSRSHGETVLKFQVARDKRQATTLPGFNGFL